MKFLLSSMTSLWREWKPHFEVDIATLQSTSVLRNTILNAAALSMLQTKILRSHDRSEPDVAPPPSQPIKRKRSNERRGGPRIIKKVWNFPPKPKNVKKRQKI